jgi:hypothetical protein
VAATARERDRREVATDRERDHLEVATDRERDHLARGHRADIIRGTDPRELDHLVIARRDKDLLVTVRPDTARPDLATCRITAAATGGGILTFVGDGTTIGTTGGRGPRPARSPDGS